MTPLREWLTPPRTLLLLLFLLTLVSVSAVGWFGWRLLQQERSVEAQRSQERLESVADRIVAAVRGTVAEIGERLGNWESAPTTGFPAPGGLLVLLKENSLSATPANQLLYYPYPSSEPEANPAAFADAELLEFAQAQSRKALEIYERQSHSPNAATRAGALLRMARVLRNMGRLEESRGVYRRLEACIGVRVAGAPAELVARHELGQVLRTELLRGRWHLTRGQFEYYWPAQGDPPPAEAVALSEVAAAVWDGRQRNLAARGQETLRIGDRAYLLVWRGMPERRAVLATKPESILGAGLQQTLASEKVLWQVADAEGNVLAGQKSSGRHAVVRTTAESQLPWTLSVAAQPTREAGMTAPQRFLLLGILVMVLFLIFGTYFIAQAIRREAETVQMQSAFVSAVSHEFRSPLTTLRQLSEILAFGRVPSEERRQLYYETLVKETSRLQRLIESLLNFGRMEAGSRRYRFEELDASALVHRVASEFEPQIAGLGRRIELQGAQSGCMIEADPDAICVALRNLLDNALKYSPDHPVVWVDWGVRSGHVAIAVRDRGPGIAEEEKKAIFRKFVRGSAAAATRANGSGVGLAMVRYIVEAHGGDITVASEPGQGSTFTMYLPALERA
jgi:signal transduction histidine kinase